MRVVVAVPSPDPRVDDLVDRIATWPGAVVERVWSGDPQLRPPGRWAAEGDLIDGFPAGVVRAVVPPALRGLLLGLARVARGESPALVVDAAVAVIPDGAVPLTRLPTGAVGVGQRGVPPIDGRTPNVADLARCGRFGTAALAVDPTIAADLVSRLVDAGGDRPPGPALAAALAGHPVEPLPVEVLGWPLAGGVDTVALVDVSHVDVTEPWHLAFDGAPPRVRLSGRPDVAPHLAALRPVPSLRAPGGVEIDAVVRNLLADRLRAVRVGDAGPPPDPWVRPDAFVDWLEAPAHPWQPDVGRYWLALWYARPDLQTAFAHLDGDDLLPFREWARRRCRHEGTSPFLRPVAPALTVPWPSDGRRPGGVDLVGHFGAEVSLSNVADRLLAAVAAVDVPHRTLDLGRTGSPPRERRVDDVLGHDTVVVVANHDQVPPLLARHGDALAGRRLIGFWHWDVEHVPDAVASQMHHFDQIWVLNEYTERTLGSVPGAPPVRSLPLPVPEPQVSSATRADLGLPSDRPVVLVTFDHLSVTERKNPLGAIEAFRRAFPDPTDAGPLLVVKSMNADQRWMEHERVRCAAIGRPDILVVDRLLAKPDQMALVAHADVLLSLHRAEGLGLHLIEAMWLGTPTIATRYSGNLTFMDDECALLVDARMVPVTRGEGFFPGTASWADPDLDQAAHHLRRLLGDPTLARRLAAAGRARMERQPSFEEIGRTIAAWCGIEVR